MIQRKAKPFIAKIIDDDDNIMEIIEFVGHDYVLAARLKTMLRKNPEIKEAQVYIAGEREPRMVVGYND